MVSNKVLQDPNLTLREKGMYAFLSSYADNLSGTTTVGVYKIAAECDVTVATVKRTLRILQDKGFIKREQRGRGSTSKTFILK